MSRRLGNPAIVSVGDRRRTGADGRPVSHGTQAAFTKFKRDFDRRLQAAGVHQLRPRNLKPKHIIAVVEQLRAEVESGARSIGAAKNWLAHLRAYVRLIDRRYLVPRTNAELGFGNRVYVPKTSKALVLTGGHLERVACPYVAMSLKLQRAFGLRREEAMKIRPEWADRGDRLVLKDTWCKGKRERELPIRTEDQRAVLDEAKALAGTTEKGSLIPTGKYVQQVKRFEYQCRKAGINGSHGLRHEYAQRRYRELAGFACPLADGPKREELTPAMRRKDYEARLEVSRELGHGRLSIVNSYCGAGEGLDRGGTDDASKKDHGSGDAGHGQGS